MSLGYIHIDMKYLPMMPNDKQKRYLLVAIDRAIRWVHFQVINNKKALPQLFLRKSPKSVL